MGMDVEAVKEAVREVLAERATVDSDVHREHHQFLKECIPLLRDFLAYRAVRMAQIERRNALLMKAKDSAVGFIAISLVCTVLGALGWVGHLVLQAGIDVINHSSGAAK